MSNESNELTIRDKDGDTLRIFGPDQSGVDAMFFTREGVYVTREDAIEIIDFLKKEFDL